MASSNRSTFNPFFYFLIFVFFGFLFALQWNHPPIEDESIITRLAVHWFEEGPKLDELYHTPLHLDMLGWWQHLFGNARDQIWVLRSFGLFCSLLTAGLFFVLGWRLGVRKEILPWFTALLVVHPYFVQGSLLIDVDNTIHTTLLLLFAGLVELSFKEKSHSLRWGLLASLAFAVVMMTKELTPLIGLVLWVGYPFLRLLLNQIPSRRPSREVLPPIVLAGAGVVLFVGFLWVWGKIHHSPTFAPFEMTIEKSSQGYSTPPWVRLESFSKFGFLTYISLLWFSLPMIATFATLAIQRKRPRSLSFSFLFGMGIVGAYTWIVQQSFYFPKYTVPAVPILLLGFALDYFSNDNAVYEDPSSVSQTKFLYSFAILGALFGALPFLSEDLDVLKIIDLRRISGFGPLLLALFLHGVCLLLPTLIAVLLVRSHRAIPAFVFLIFYFMGTNLYQAFASYETRYLYGEKGFEETVSTVASMKEKNSFILSPSIDLAWRFSPDSAVVFREVGQDQPVFDPRTSSDRVVAAFKNDPKNAIWVGRNYGVRQLDPNAYLALDSRFRCRIEIPKEAQRFLILSNSEDCNSKAPFSN